MARRGGVTPVIGTAGVRALQRDLKALDPDAGVAMRRLISASVQPIASEARRRMPVGDDRKSKGSSSPHIRDTIKGKAAGTRGVIESRHPGARVNEFGGTIAPKGTPITIPRRMMIYGAIAELREATARRLGTEFELIARRHGFH